ncbi:MAG: hypothetical protein ACKVOR_08560, partial [Flavobacteriales bacterium]
MKPCFMIEYPSKWSGASSNESNWRMDGDGSRFMDWRYLYPGSTVTATLHDGNRDISIETSYKHLLRKKPKVVNDLEYDYNYGRNYSYDVTDKVVETTYETFNGFTYKIEYVSRTYVNSKNKVKRSFFYNAQCDTSFSNHYYLAIETTEWSKDKKKLTNRLAGVKISHIAPSALDDMYARHFDEPAFRSATVRSFEHWKKQFMQYTYNQLSCTSAESVHSWTMERISEDSVVDLLAQFNYKLLADVIVEHHEKFVHLANDTYFDYVYKWKYSLEYEYNKYKLIGEGKADINHFLNYLDDDSTATFIDTLDAFRILRSQTAQEITESMGSDDWDAYFEEWKHKRPSDVEAEFIRQFSIQHLEGDPLLTYKYRKVLDEPGNKIYLFLPSANYALHSVLGIFTRQPDNTWKYELDQLEFNAEADGEQDFTPFNNA